MTVLLPGFWYNGEEKACTFWKLLTCNTKFKIPRKNQSKFQNTAFLLVYIPIWRDLYALTLREIDTSKLGSSLGVSSIFVKLFVYVSMGQWELSKEWQRSLIMWPASAGNGLFGQCRQAVYQKKIFS